MGEFTGHQIISHWEIIKLMSRILLSIDRYQQPLPIAHLNTEHEVMLLDWTSEPNSEFILPKIAFDLCILDEANFDRIGPMVETLKTAAEPSFLPFLLLIKSQTPTLSEQQFLLSAKQLEGRIDDLIVSPVDAAQLHLRLENLFARRRLSLELYRLQEVIKERTFTESLLIDSLQTANQNLQREIAKRAEVEAALRSKTYLDLLMNAMPDIACFKDGEGRWQEANQAILELFELSADKYRGLKDSELGELSIFYRDALQACEVSDRAAWAKGTLSRGEEVIPRSNGTVKIYDVIKVPVFHPDGRRKSIVILGSDITEQKQAQDELVRLSVDCRVFRRRDSGQNPRRDDSELECRSREDLRLLRPGSQGAVDRDFSHTRTPQGNPPNSGKYSGWSHHRPLRNRAFAQRRRTDRCVPDDFSD